MALNARPAGRSIGLLAHLGEVFAPAGLRRHAGALETIDDHLLKDIGRARGACGFDRRNTTGF